VRRRDDGRERSLPLRHCRSRRHPLRV